MKNSPKFIGLSDSRLFHMRGGAYKSYNLAREVFNMEEDTARGLFLMGLVHDFAYAFVENQTEHEHEGGRILELSGFDWAEAVFDQRCFYQAFEEFDNQNIDKSLSSDNLIVRIFAVLDRRVGKRRLISMRAIMEEQPPVFQEFYAIRMHHEGL